MQELSTMDCYLLYPASNRELKQNYSSTLQSEIDINIQGHAALNTGATNQILMRHLYVYVFCCALMRRGLDPVSKSGLQKQRSGRL